MDNTAYYVAGIDVHKRMLAVVVAKCQRPGTAVRGSSVWYHDLRTAETVAIGCKNAPSRKS